MKLDHSTFPPKNPTLMMMGMCSSLKRCFPNNRESRKIGPHLFTILSLGPDSSCRRGIRDKEQPRAIHDFTIHDS